MAGSACRHALSLLADGLAEPGREHRRACGSTASLRDDTGEPSRTLAPPDSFPDRSWDHSLVAVSRRASAVGAAVLVDRCRKSGGYCLRLDAADVERHSRTLSA